MCTERATERGKNTYIHLLPCIHPLFCEEERVSMYAISVAKSFRVFPHIHSVLLTPQSVSRRKVWVLHTVGNVRLWRHWETPGKDHRLRPHCGYVYLSMLIMQLQLRDYPHPLFQGTNWRASGRIVFAEQEAQERGLHILITYREWDNWKISGCELAASHYFFYKFHSLFVVAKLRIRPRFLRKCCRDEECSGGAESSLEERDHSEETPSSQVLLWPWDGWVWGKHNEFWAIYDILYPLCILRRAQILTYLRMLHWH